MARLIVADDHEVVRQGIRSVIGRDPGLVVVAEAADGVEAERLASEIPADLLLLDIALPKKGGMQVLTSLRASGNRLPVLFFSMHPADQYADCAQRNGAHGYVFKGADSRDLLRTIHNILGGGNGFAQRNRFRCSEGDPFAALSRRETEVMHGLLRGESISAIAASIGVGVTSATTYRRRLLDKLGVLSNAELGALAARHGKV